MQASKRLSVPKSRYRNGAGHLLRRRSLCYILIMRQWMRERMRRRSKRGPNDSESTGKIGQEIPANQPTPLQPMYPEDNGSGRPEPAAADSQRRDAEQPQHAETAVRSRPAARSLP